MGYFNDYLESKTGSGLSSPSNSQTDVTDLISQILEKNKRLSQSNTLPKFNTPAPDFSWLGKAANVLSTGQKVTAKTINDLLMEGKLPTAEEYKYMVNPETSYSYSDVLKNLGMKEGLGRTVLGTGLDIVGDPLTWIPLAKVGSMVGKGFKLGEKLPGIGKAFVKVGETGKEISNLVRQARKIMPYVGKGETEIYNITQGFSSRRAKEIEELASKYREVYQGAKIADEYKPIVNQAMERFGTPQLGELMAQLPEKEQNFVRGFHNLLNETGLEKEAMGAIKGRIGSKEMREMLEKKGVDVIKDVNVAASYEPHFITPEAKKLAFSDSATPDEIRNTLSGLAQKYKLKSEKSRTLFGTINEYNKKFAEEHGGVKLFIDDPEEVLKKYSYSLGKQKAQYDMAQEMFKVVGDDGLPIIKKITGKVPSSGNVKLNGLLFDGYEANPEVAKLINRVDGVFGSDELTNKFLSFYDKTLKWFKYSVTMPWPTFNFNNLMGAEFNNFIYDIKTMAELPNAIKIMTKKYNPEEVIVAKNGVKKTLGELINYWETRGGVNTFSKLETGGAELVRNRAQKIARGYAINFPNNIETLVRSQIGLSEFKKTGSLSDSLQAIWRVHGNYSNEALSGFEKNVAARVFPFYRWMKTSIPFQFENLYNKTGKYAAIAKIENAVISPEERNKLPESVRDKFIVWKGKNKNGETSVRSADLPMMDIAKYFNIPSKNNLNPLNLRGIAGAMSPQLKLPAELTFNKQLFTDQPISDENLPRELQVSKVTNPLLMMPGIKQTMMAPGINKLTGMREVQKENKQTGKMEPYLEMNSKLQYILSQLGPITSLSGSTKRIQREIESQGVDSSAAQTIAAGLSGIMNPVKLTNYNPTEEEYWKLNDLNNKLQAIINYGIPRGMVKRKK